MSLSVPKPNVVQTQSSSPTNASSPPLSSPVVSLGWSSHFYQQLQEAGMMPSIVSRCRPPLVCLEEKLLILVGGSTVSATLLGGGSWTELPGLAACWEGAVLSLALAHLPPG